jgi:predicted HTH transcriptional regulator
MRDEEYRAIIFAGSEDRNREYKQSFPWQRSTHTNTMAKVTKTILAMANLQDGGHIIIGVEEDNNDPNKFIPSGLTDAHLQTYAFEEIADYVRPYADPFVRMYLDQIEMDGMTFVVITIPGFEGVPVICKRSHSNILSEGNIYYRPRGGRPRSEPISNYSDMRDLIDLSVDYGVRDFLARRKRVDSILATDEEQFDEELGDFS